MIKRILLPVIILAVALFGARWLSQNPPGNDRRAAPPPKPLSVEVVDVTKQAFTLSLASFGTVRPHTQGSLTSQVGGQITAISRDFAVGNAVEKGQLLLQIDPRDYQVALASAKASLTEAQQNLALERAQVAQAVADWKRLGNAGNPPALVSRKPQEKIARARVAAAQANVDSAELNLQRTRITAPYTGKILSRSVAIGEVVNAGTALGTLYASDSLEVRLPVKNADLRYLSVTTDDDQTATEVTFSSDLLGQGQWRGQLLRMEAAIDEASQQLYAIAKLDNNSNPNQELTVGQYLEASIQGDRLEQAIVIDNRAIYQGSYVYLVEDGALRRRDISIAWQGQNQALISQGLSAGEKLVISPLGQVSSGTPVRIKGSELAAPSPAKAEANP